MNPYKLFMQLCLRALGKRVYIPDLDNPKGKGCYKTFDSDKSANSLVKQYNLILSELIIALSDENSQEIDEDSIKTITTVCNELTSKLYNT